MLHEKHLLRHKTQSCSQDLDSDKLSPRHLRPSQTETSKKDLEMVLRPGIETYYTDVIFWMIIVFVKSASEHMHAVV